MQGLESINVDALYRLAREKSLEGRQALARTISELFSEHGENLTPRERGLMLDILHRVIRDAEMAVRRRISEHLAACSDVPKELVQLLANDDSEVAYPILLKSRLLMDADLIEIVRNRTFEHQLAVALREDISEQVADALVETRNDSVIQTLLRNENARISRATMEWLVEQSRRVDTFREPLLLRRELNADLAKRMFLFVTAALRKVIVERYNMPPDVIDDLLEKAVFNELESDVLERASTNRREELAQILAESDEVTPDLLLAILEEGEITLFISVFQRLTEIPERLIQRMLFEVGGEGLAIACRAVGLDKVVFSAIFSLTRRARPQLRRSAERDLQRVLVLYNQMKRDSARKILRMWQRDEDYLSAIQELELSSN